jgi:hypothetical protein
MVRWSLVIHSSVVLLSAPEDGLWSELSLVERGRSARVQFWIYYRIFI